MPLPKHLSLLISIKRGRSCHARLSLLRSLTIIPVRVQVVESSVYAFVYLIAVHGSRVSIRYRRVVQCLQPGARDFDNPRL
jgi:hypothetical protein